MTNVGVALIPATRKLDTYLYVDDCLVVSENPKRFFRDQIGKYLIVKEKSIREPDHCLGRKVRKVELANGARCWPSARRNTSKKLARMSSNIWSNEMLISIMQINIIYAEESWCPNEE